MVWVLLASFCILLSIPLIFITIGFFRRFIFGVVEYCRDRATHHEDHFVKAKRGYRSRVTWALDWAYPSEVCKKPCIADENQQEGSMLPTRYKQDRMDSLNDDL